MIDILKIREDFPILSRKVNGQNLIYFDNAATSQTPQQVIDVIIDYYTRLNSNIHRGCLLYTSPSPRDMRRSRMPSSA